MNNGLEYPKERVVGNSSNYDNHDFTAQRLSRFKHFQLEYLGGFDFAAQVKTAVTVFKLLRQAE
jgi:hypothetical protein